MFEKGQKVYRLSNYYHNFKEWTFIRKETTRNGGGWVLYDEDDRYRTIFDIENFTADKEYVELQKFKNDLKSFTNAIRENKEDIVEAENNIIYCKQEIEKFQKEIEKLNKRYIHLMEKYPEEFI